MGLLVSLIHQSALEGVESTYLQFRRAADAFLDSFELGQRAVDADLVGVPNTELVGSPPSNVAAFASLGRVVLKLVDPTGVGFNALYVGVDFGVVVQRAYAASVVPAGELPPEEGDEGGGIGQVAKDGGSSGDKGEQRAGRTVTLVFEPVIITQIQTSTSANFATKDVEKSFHKTSGDRNA